MQLLSLLSLLSSVWFLYSVRTSTCHPPCCCVQACWSVCVCASGIASISSPACQSFDFPPARLVIETGPEPGGALVFASMQMRKLQPRAFACAHPDLSGSGGLCGARLRLGCWAVWAAGVARGGPSIRPAASTPRAGKRLFLAEERSCWADVDPAFLQGQSGGLLGPGRRVRWNNPAFPLLLTFPLRLRSISNVCACINHKCKRSPSGARRDRGRPAAQLSAPKARRAVT